MASMNSSSQRGPPRGRNNARGGIQKKGNSQVRPDRDGDLNMDGPGPARGRAAPRNRRSASPNMNHNRRSTSPSRNSRNRSHEDGRRSNRPGRNPFTTVKRALNNQGNNGSKGGAARFAAALEEASKGLQSPGTRPNLAQITVRGWTKSKAASNPGGCQQQLVEFLERKASNTGKPEDRKNVRISKSNTEGDTLTVSVKADFVPSLLRLDGFTFVGVPLSIKETQKSADQPMEAPVDSMQLKDRIKSMLERRYNPAEKLLDLSSMGTDPEFASSGIFDSPKFFPALMKVCGDMAPTMAQKRELVTSVLLQSNNLVDVSTVTTLAQTFPELKNLDLSNNNLRDLKALEAWRRRFRSLDHLIVAGNPLETVPNYADELVQWYPTLRLLNGVQVRSDEQIAAASKGKLVVPVARPCFQDEASIGANFVTYFFPQYDADRSALASNFYDENSTFSHSINTSAKRLEEKTAGWDQYIRGSRNMLKITSMQGRKQRENKGTNAINAAWAKLPPTAHPDLQAESSKWCIECHPLAGLPDPAGVSGTGVGGLIIYVHGEFSEVDARTRQASAKRSFDRTFVLGPGSGLGGIRVLSDLLVVRAYGGNGAFQPDDADAAAQPTNNVLTASPTVVGTTLPTKADPALAAALPPFAAADVQLPTGLVAPPGFAQPGPDKLDELVAKERLALQLATATRLTLQYAGMALEENGWNLEAAGTAVEEAKSRGAVPADAFF